METKYDISLMVKVARMYHQDGLKQDEIAGRLQLSRALISMILSEARDTGIVEISIRNPLVNNEGLSDKLKKSFSLKKCIVIPTSLQDPDTLRRLVAQRAADIFNSEADSGKTIGLTWGRTCFQFITSFNTDKDLKDISVIPLIGGSNQKAGYYQLNEMVRQFSEKLGGMPYFIHAPALASSEEEREMYLNCKAMQPIVERWKNIDIIVMGIGALTNESGTERETYNGENEIRKTYEENEAVGDICARYFKVDGKFIKDGFYKRVIGIPIEDVRNSKTVIGIATGLNKAYTILGALRTKIMDVFITDEQTAKAVLKAGKINTGDV